jgi:cobalt-zinc-cadmium efflux system protein
VLLLTASYMVAEVAGGLYSGSLALLADAGHMLTDVVALALALFATWFSGRPATSHKTFGYYRLEILAALVNGVTLIIVSLFIFREAYERWFSPPEVNSTAMMAVAAGGLFINLLGAWLLHGDHKENLNVRGAWLHIIGDALGSFGAIIAGLLMTLYGWYIADPAFSIVIGALIIWSSWQIIREATNVLLEGTPAHINLAAVEDTFRETDGVADVHDLHVWTITSGREALSAHVVHTERAAPPELLRRLRTKLRERFGVDHLTIQMETVEFASDAAHPCHTLTDCFNGKSKGEGRK